MSVKEFHLSITQLLKENFLPSNLDLLLNNFFECPLLPPSSNSTKWFWINTVLVSLSTKDSYKVSWLVYLFLCKGKSHLGSRSNGLLILDRKWRISVDDVHNASVRHCHSPSPRHCISTAHASWRAESASRALSTTSGVDRVGGGIGFTGSSGRHEPPFVAQSHDLIISVCTTERNLYHEPTYGACAAAWRRTPARMWHLWPHVRHLLVHAVILRTTCRHGSRGDLVALDVMVAVEISFHLPSW